MSIKRISRRDFMKGSALTGAGLLLAACGATATQAPAATTAPAAPAATTAPAANAAPTTAPAAQGAVTIRFITNHGASDVPLFQKVIDNFKTKAPNITIDHLDIAGGTDFYNSINTQGAAKQLPDVWYTRTFDVPVYASKGWTVSLQDMVSRDSTEVNVDDFWPAEVKQMTWQGKLFALPYDFSNMGIYYNKTAFAKAGVTDPPATWKWDDLASLAQKLIVKDAKGKFTTFGVQFSSGNWIGMGMLFGWGGKVFSDDLSTCVINSPQNADCMKWFIAQRKLGLYPDSGSMPAGVDPFASGLVPMQMQGSWDTTNMRDTVKDKFEYDCTALPLSLTGQSCINAAGGAWGIAANSKNIEAAWTWNKFLTSTDSTNVLISDPLRSIPGRKSSAVEWNKVAAQGGLPPKNVAVFSTQMAIATAQAYPSYWQSFVNVWTNMLDPLWNGATDDDPATVLKQVEDETNRLAKQNS